MLLIIDIQPLRALAEKALAWANLFVKKYVYTKNM